MCWPQRKEECKVFCSTQYSINFYSACAWRFLAPAFKFNNSPAFHSSRFVWLCCTSNTPIVSMIFTRNNKFDSQLFCMTYFALIAVIRKGHLMNTIFKLIESF